MQGRGVSRIFLKWIGDGSKSRCRSRTWEGVSPLHIGCNSGTAPERKILEFSF